MSDGHHRPPFVAPTLGGELEKYGMEYDTSEHEQPLSKRQQKRDRKRNNNNRRDNNNRPPKELTMENTNVSDKNNGAIESSKNPNLGDDKDRGISAMVSTLDRGFQQIDRSLQQFGAFTQDLNQQMILVVRDTTETRTEVKKLNAWSRENILGDVRKALVQIGVGGAIAGAIALVTYAFKKDEVEEVPGTAPTTSATNGAARPRATT